MIELKFSKIHFQIPFRTKDQNLQSPLFKYDKNQNFLMSKNWRIILKKMGLLSVLHEKYRFYINYAYPNTKQNHFHNKNDHFTGYFSEPL